jgi:acyl-[acyl-carrier-protein]-phospholipid O-acyltransferase/long-chain-fatty-acid--[acyl-carrier-protein] ligase
MRNLVSKPESIDPYDPTLTADVAPSAPVASPALLADRSFWGMTATQFLGAFNDNVYKQTLLLLFVSVPWGVDDAGHAVTKDLQGFGSGIFALPFILFSGFAGYLSDRFSKQRVIFCCKLAEVAIMLVGLGLFLIHDRAGMSLGMAGLFTMVLFLMGSHSAFFGPGKYGILPELFRERDLPAANGIILMTTFLAIIFGTALSGGLMTKFANELWVIGATCIGIALLGVGTSLLVFRTPAVRPGLPFRAGYLGIPREMRELLRSDNQLNAALWVSSVFWMAAAMVLLAVNSLGDRQFGAEKFQTSILVGSVSVGIALGSVVTGLISGGRFHTGLLKTGAWGLFVFMTLIALPGPRQGHLLGYTGSLVCLIILGAFTGMFAVPLQVLMQLRPPRELKGQMIATMNLLNWTGIVLGGALYQGVTLLLELLHWPPATAFAVMAVMFGLVAVLYRPREVEK